MICKVKASVQKYGLLNENVKSVAVGFSGGADSVCLLHILSSLKDEYGIIVKAVHVNHNIRGEEALRDENFAIDFCQRNGIELKVFSVDVPELAKEKKLSLEECGRFVRYECFKKAECDAVAVAHTLSDSIETMLFNLARGTGSKGLTGISPKREPNIIRPLIDCTRKEIEEYCQINGLNYVCDSTNLSDDYTRNHIRHNLVPGFSKINKDFENAFMRAMANLRSDNEYLDICAKKLLDESKCPGGYNRILLLEAEPPIQKRSLLFLLKSAMEKPPEAKHVEAFSQLLRQKNSKTEIGKDLYIFSCGDIISIRHPEKDASEWRSDFIRGISETPFGKFQLVSTDVGGPDCFDADKVEGELFLSSRLPGDSFTFSGRRITKSLKKLFNELKIPIGKRNQVAVLHDGNNVVWIEDIGVNSKYIPNFNTQKIITIKRMG